MGKKTAKTIEKQTPRKRQTNQPELMEAFRKAVAKLTGKEPNDLTLWPDPTEPGTWGARARFDVNVAYFLHRVENGPTPTAESVQEVPFSDWPPWHGSRRGYWPRGRSQRGLKSRSTREIVPPPPSAKPKNPSPNPRRSRRRMA